MESAALEEILTAEEPDWDRVLALRRAIFSSEEARKEFDGFVRAFKTKVKLSSENKQKVRRALVYWLSGETERALEELEDTVASRERQFVSGMCHLDLGNYARAADALSEVCAAYRDRSELGARYAEALALGGRREEAAKLVEKLRKDEQNADGLYLDGLILELEGARGEAMKKYEEALDIEPDHQKALFRLAYNYDLLGMDDQAMDLYNQIRMLRPLHVNTLINLAVLHEDRGEDHKAIECYQAILESRPNHWRAKMYLKDAQASLQMFYDEEALKREEQRRQLSRQHVADMQLSTRTKNALLKAEITTLADLVSRTEEELQGIPGLGQTGIREIKEILQTRRLALATQRRLTPDEHLQSIHPDLRNRSIGELSLSSALQQTLERGGLQTIGDLVRRSEEELVRSLQITEADLEEVRQKLARLGVALRAS